MLGLLLVAVSLGLSNFAASAGLGAAGAPPGTRWRLAVVFGVFETGMPIAGLLLGRGLAGDLGSAARWTGAGLLMAVGGYTLWQGWRRGAEDEARPAAASGARLVAAGFALSLDNLAVGFGLGTLRVGLPVAVLVIGAVSVTLSLLGLELGGRLGARAGRGGDYLSGLLLIAVGAAIGAGLL